MSKQIAIPDVTNKTASEAVSTLQDAGFTVADKQIEEASSEVAKGSVIKTNPIAGSERKKGFEITLYVSTGNNQVTIEDYTGKNYSEIKGKLEALGLQVLVEKKDVSTE